MVAQPVHLAVVLAVAAAAAAAAPATPSPSPAAAKPSAAKSALTQDMATEGPLAYRCDGGDLLSNPNRLICRGNVIMSRADILFCCQRFEATLDETSRVQALTCFGDVRARRGDQTVWAERADYSAATSELVLRGKPVLRRGQSLVEGESATFKIDTEEVRMEKPRGILVKEDLPAATVDPKSAAAVAVDITKMVVCPLPPVPKH